MSRGLIVSAVAALAALAALPGLAVAKGKRVEIRVLSSRADLVSGGDALVQVKPAGAKVSIGRRGVTKRFAVRPDGRYLALLTGLRDGKNVVTARKGGRAARLVVRNHPIGGPLTAGPQIQPWTCFPEALDKQCNREPEHEYWYKPSDGGSFAPYDPESPPSDVATTTTDTGETVPFIVREEVGALDRDEYRIAALYDPAKPSAPWAPPAGLNGRLVIFHGASCDTAYEQASAPDVMNETALGHGFVTMSHALNNAGHNCNIATQAESMIMTKERVAEQFGPVRWTIGSGCSGGALVQQQVANAYPGLYQGITPACSFTDAWSSAMQYVNYQLLRQYYENPSAWAPGVVWTPDDMAAVEGHFTPLNAVTFTEVIPSSGDPSRPCPGVPAEDVYDPQSNPKGVRCTLHDYMRNVFGPRAKDGLTGRPVGNVGLQYGLKPLLRGEITVAQFLDVNEKIGSFDMDYNPISERMDADRPALDRAYRSGAVNQADNLDSVAIIDMRGPDPGAFHDVYRTYTMRARLDRNFGTHANQILWRGQVAVVGDHTFTDESILAIDGWLAAVAKDRRRIPLAKKIIADRPKTLVDRCTDGNGNDIEASACDATVVAYSDPQLEAGMPETNDTTRCNLKPLDRNGYEGVTFSDEQWTAMQALYPQGVCDFTKPGLGRHPTRPWQTYQDARGRAIYGGRPLGPAPRSRPLARP
jgi:hypothetical protein